MFLQCNPSLVLDGMLVGFPPQLQIPTLFQPLFTNLDRLYPLPPGVLPLTFDVLTVELLHCFHSVP